MENVKLFLLSNLSVIIGKDEKKVIKDACKVMSSIQGTMISSFFMSGTKEKNFGLDIGKNQVDLLYAADPLDELKQAYLNFLSGETITQKKIIVPKNSLN